MSSTTNGIGTLMPVKTSTAATSVSKVEFTTKSSNKVQSGFDGILSKVSDTMINARTVDVKKTLSKGVDPKKADLTENINQRNDQTKANDNTSKLNDAKTNNTNTDNASKVSDENIKEPLGEEINSTNIQETDTIN